MDGGSGHSGKRAPLLHFGLGAVDPRQPLPVDVRWRDGAGHVRSATYRLTPGRHTLQLSPPQQIASMTGKAGA